MNRAWDYWATVDPYVRKPFQRISLQLVGILARFAPHDAEAFELEPGKSLGELMTRLGIREDEVMLAFVNGKTATRETLIPDRATVMLCPCISGE